MNSLPKTVTRQHRGCDFNPGPSAPESSTLTTRLPSHRKPGKPYVKDTRDCVVTVACLGWSMGRRFMGMGGFGYEFCYRCTSPLQLYENSPVDVTARVMLF